MFNNVYIKVFVIDKITNSAFSYTVGLVVSDGTVVIALDADVCGQMGGQKMLVGVLILSILVQYIVCEIHT